MLRFITLLFFCLSFVASQECEKDGLILKKCSTGITKTCQNMHDSKYLYRPCFDTCVCPIEGQVYSEKQKKCVLPKECEPKKLRCKSLGLVKKSCRTGVIPTCVNWHFELNKQYLNPESECFDTCACADDEEVYHPELRKCVPKRNCTDIMRQNKACFNKDPNSEMRGCIKSYCGDKPCKTRECHYMCSCKDGFLLSEDKQSCINA